MASANKTAIRSDPAAAAAGISDSDSSQEMRRKALTYARYQEAIRLLSGVQSVDNNLRSLPEQLRTDIDRAVDQFFGHPEK